ncbi:MAG: DUF2938 domain-containing protein [Alphaproteobacteria bacterium]|nr:DUF2938 domain-containing protein [Alphaproteobacteria bacterium]
MMQFYWKALVIGFGGTLAMDVWALVLAFGFGMALPNWGLVGRWFTHLAQGRFFHDDIALAQPHPFETLVGWLAHYAIGIFYAALLIFLAGPGWLASPTFLPAFLIGMITVGAGWFILQPGMGAGWAASLHPNPMQVRFLNLVAHAVFAAGLYGTALVLARA